MPQFLVQQAEREDGRNKKVRAAVSAAHLKALHDIVFGIVEGTLHPFALSDFAAKAIQNGLPVRNEVLTAGEYVLRMEAHYMAMVMPSMPAWIKTHARGWLAHKLKKDPQNVEGGIFGNLALGGEVINPSGE